MRATRYKAVKTGVAALALAAVAAITGVARAQAPAASGPYLFAYFKEPGNQGIYLALSRDGYTYTPLNDGQPWVKTEQPGEIMRDVFLTHNPDGHGFRMVWTWNWRGNAIGTSESPDLLSWTPHRKIEIMREFPRVHNTWAPETYWDEAKKEWLIIFSSSFDPVDATRPPEKSDGLRIWASRTKDWETFSKPTMFFDRGFPAIDATMFHRTLNGKKDVVLVVKDQTPDPLRYDERWASGPTVEGPWGPLSGPIDESWSEGPSVVQVGDHAVVFYDHYRPPQPRYEAVETTDWVHWTSADDKIHLPESCKHGSFLRITEAEAERLLARHDAPAGASTPSPAAAVDSH